MSLIYSTKNMINKSVFSNECLKAKREFLRFLKENDSLILYKNNFIKTHVKFWDEYNFFKIQNFGYSFDDLVKARYTDGIAEILKWSFTYHKTKEYELWYKLHTKLRKYDNSK